MTQRTSQILLAAVLVLAAGGAARAADAPTTRRAPKRGVTIDLRSFDLRATPPPSPALKYQLAFEANEGRPGSMAAAYLQAALMLTYDDQTWVDKALDADGAGDRVAFDTATKALFDGEKNVLPIVDRLDAACRSEQGGLAAEWSGNGFDALMPQLNPMRGLANLLYARAREQSTDGHAVDAIATLRLGYKMAHDVADGTPLLGGLVGIGIAGRMDDGLTKLMSAPDAPNLYWALATLPRPVVSFRRVMDGERRWQVDTIPALARTRAGDVTAADLSDFTQAADRSGRRPGHRPPPERLQGSAATEITMLVLTHPDISAYYGQLHHLPLAEAMKVDPQLRAATYMVGRFQEASDEMYKWLDQPYPILIPRMHGLSADLRRQGFEDWNLFAIAVPSYAAVVDNFAVGDRSRAALTAVEALRSYAAAHGGRLPEQLADVIDTPVPANPVTGKPFEYRVVDGVATLADHDPLLADRPLEYTVRVQR